MIPIALHWQILVALLAGAAAGWLIGPPVLEIAFIGTLFLNALKMIIVPLIGTSIITGIAAVGKTGRVGRLGGKTFAYYLTTSLFSILTGLILVNLVQPGVGVELGLSERPERLADSLERFGDTPGQAVQRLLLDLIPTNPVASMAEGNILQVIFFCLLFGYFITRLPDGPRQHLSGFFDAAFETMMKLTNFIISFAPIGIFALVAKTVAQTGFDAFAGLGLYVLTVFIGLVIHAGVNLPLLLYFIGRANPMDHFRAMAPALLTAFSTSSSSATLPLTMKSLEERAGVSNRVTSFVTPLGATVNMDGTALYECVAAMFIAQAYGISLDFTQQFLVVLTALLASIGAAGIPMAGLVMISVILSAVGLPLEGVGLILAVDRILDMCRTTVNVWSDATGAKLIAQTEDETPAATAS
jgi:proton glutamate symport protein